MDPKHSYLHIYTRKAEIDFYDTEEQEVWKQSKERIKNAGLEDGSDVTTSQGISAASWNWERQTEHLP